MVELRHSSHGGSHKSLSPHERLRDFLISHDSKANPRDYYVLQEDAPLPRPLQRKHIRAVEVLTQGVLRRLHPREESFSDDHPDRIRIDGAGEYGLVLRIPRGLYKKFNETEAVDALNVLESLEKRFASVSAAMQAFKRQLPDASHLLSPELSAQRDSVNYVVNLGGHGPRVLEHCQPYLARALNEPLSGWGRVFEQDETSPRVYIPEDRMKDFMEALEGVHAREVKARLIEALKDPLKAAREYASKHARADGGRFAGV